MSRPPVLLHAYLCALAALLGCAVAPPVDDVHEPNDRPLQATLLESGQGLQLRVNAGSPDVLAIELDRPGPLRIGVSTSGSSAGLDILLTDEDGLVLVDHKSGGAAGNGEVARYAPGASLAHPARHRGADQGLEVHLEHARAGRYYLTLSRPGVPGHAPPGIHRVRLRLD